MQSVALLLAAIYSSPVEYRTYEWDNAAVVACGAVTTCDKVAITVPARSVIDRAWIVVTGQAAGPTTVTASIGIDATDYNDLVTASSVKAAAATVYGGSALTDTPNMAQARTVNLQFISTGANLSTVTGSTGRAVIELRRLPPVFANATLNLTSPKSGSMAQKGGSIAIAGSVVGTCDVEARIGGNWATVAAGASGAFSGALSTPSYLWQGLLEVRCAGTLAEQTVQRVAVGEIFHVWGQSNTCCVYAALQSYTARPPGRSFRNDYQWGPLVDCVDDTTGQLDAISRDTAQTAPGVGSIWPRVGTVLATRLDVPVAFVPSGMGGTTMAQWAPGGTISARDTLYRSAAYRVQQVGGRGIVFHQGEGDAMNGRTQAQYNADLDTLANAAMSDLGLKILVALLQNSTGIGNAAEALIRAAVTEAAGDNANVLLGPDFSDQSSDDDYHFTSDAKAAIAAQRWSDAIVTRFGL